MSRWPLPSPGAVLRLLEPPDAVELFALCERNRSRLGTYLPWIHRTHTVADVAAFLGAAAQQHKNGLGFHAGIAVDGHLLGCAGMHPIDREHRSVALGYWIDEAAEGRGLVTLATTQLVRLCWEDYGLHRVEIRCAASNARSRAVPRRLGFREEGLLRAAQWVNGVALDQYVFSKLATD